MATPLSAAEMLEREFLEVRAKILQIAASLDRFDRASGSLADDARLIKLQQGLKVLQSDSGGRAERLQLLFSRPYDPEWRAAMDVRPAAVSATSNARSRPTP